jgi:hypothetical protein
LSDIFEQPDDAATPLTDNEKRELIPTHITYRRETQRGGAGEYYPWSGVGTSPPTS